MAQKLVEQVKEFVNAKPVVIYVKGTPNFPQCGFSARACEALEAAGAKDVAAFDVLTDDAMWGALEEFTQWPTVPQIFVHGKFIGGCDIVTEMHQTGELARLIKSELDS